MMQMTQEQRIKIIDFLMVSLVVVTAVFFTTSELNFVLPDIGTITSLMANNPIKITMSLLAIATTFSDRYSAYAIAFKQYMQNLVMPIENIPESRLIDSSTNTNNNNITTTPIRGESVILSTASIITNQTSNNVAQMAITEQMPTTHTTNNSTSAHVTEQAPTNQTFSTQQARTPLRNDNNQRRPFDNIAKFIAICSSATIGGVFYRYRNQLLSTIDRYFNNHTDENTKQKETQTSKPKP